MKKLKIKYYYENLEEEFEEILDEPTVVMMHMRPNYKIISCDEIKEAGDD